MSKKSICVVVWVVFLIGVLSGAGQIHRVEAQLGTIFIRADGSVDPSTLLLLRTGSVYTFTDNISVDAYEGIVIERDNMTLDGAGYVLSGLPPAGAGGSGIKLEGRRNVTIKDLEIRQFHLGIKLLSSSNNSIIENLVTANAWWGIDLVDSSNNTISDNNITINRDGVRLLGSPDNVLRGNSLDDNYWGFNVLGDKLSDYVNFVDDSNTVNGKPVYYLINRRGLLIDEATYDDVGFLALVNSTDITVKDLHLGNNGHGLLLAYSNSIAIQNDTIADNRYTLSALSSFNITIYGNHLRHSDTHGIHLWNSSYCNILENEVINCNREGIFLENSSYITIIGNNVTDARYGSGVRLLLSSGNNLTRNSMSGNRDSGMIFQSSNENVFSGNTLAESDVGIYISDSSNLTIVHNNFINNTQQAVMDDAELISWDDGVEGNYWDNCVGVDLEVGGDGVGDTPHTIDVNNTDTHPLMGPIRFFDAGTWNGNPYWIHTTSNSTISDFHFNASQKMASFNVSGVSPNTTGFCRVAIPKDLLWAEEPSWVVSVNGSIVSVRAQVYTNLTYLYFTYNHSIQNVRIYGTEVIPEFSTLPILSILAILTLSVVGLNATLHKGRNTKGEDFPAFERVEQERAKSTYTQHKEC